MLKRLLVAAASSVLTAPSAFAHHGPARPNTRRALPTRDVDEIAFAQRAVRRNAVRHLLVDADARGAGEPIREPRRRARAAATQSRPRFVALVLTLFAGVSLALAAIGIYGVIAYSVAQRTKEFGIRMALGARPNAVQNLELGRGLTLTAAGVLLGVAGAYALTRFLAAFLFGVPATDVPTFAGVAALLALVATAASYVAARRATQVDPLVALRTE